MQYSFWLACGKHVKFGSVVLCVENSSQDEQCVIMCVQLQVAHRKVATKKLARWSCTTMTISSDVGRVRGCLLVKQRHKAVWLLFDSTHHHVKHNSWSCRSFSLNRILFIIWPEHRQCVRQMRWRPVFAKTWISVCQHTGVVILQKHVIITQQRHLCMVTVAATRLLLWGNMHGVTTCQHRHCKPLSYYTAVI